MLGFHLIVLPGPSVRSLFPYSDYMIYMRQVRSFCSPAPTTALLPVQSILQAVHPIPPLGLLAHLLSFGGIRPPLASTHPHRPPGNGGGPGAPPRAPYRLLSLVSEALPSQSLPRRRDGRRGGGREHTRSVRGARPTSKTEKHQDQARNRHEGGPDS